MAYDGTVIGATGLTWPVGSCSGVVEQFGGNSSFYTKHKKLVCTFSVSHDFPIKRTMA